MRKLQDAGLTAAGRLLLTACGSGDRAYGAGAPTGAAAPSAPAASAPSAPATAAPSAPGGATTPAGEKVKSASGGSTSGYGY